MKRFSLPTLLVVLALLVGACGQQAAPTAAPVDLQATIAAAAFTVIAETQAAIPTSTPLPRLPTVTNTVPATITLIPSPTPIATGPTPIPSSTAGNDPCVNQPLPPVLQGKAVHLRVYNATSAELAFSVYLNSNETQRQCGYRTYTLSPEQPLIISDLVEGCYTLWAWNPIPEDYFIVTNGTSCLDASQEWRFDVSTKSITLK